MKRIILIIMPLILLSACEKDSDNGGGAPPPGAEDYLPLLVGNWWKFDGVEVDPLGVAIAETEYSTSTSIVGDTVASGISYFIMQDSSDQSGSWEQGERQYARITGDTVKFAMYFFDDTTNLREANMGILPNNVGATWTAMSLDTFFVEQPGETTWISLDWTGEVLAYDTLVVPAGTFGDSYHLKYTMEFTFETADTTMAFDREMKVWLAPNVGMAHFFQLPIAGPGDPEPGALEELADYSVGLP